MIGVIYISLALLAEVLYLVSQFKVRRTYMWRHAIVSIALIGLATWMGGIWWVHCMFCALMVGLMIAANGSWLDSSDNDKSWTVRNALYGISSAIVCYVFFVGVFALADESKKDESLVIWAIVIVASLLLTYTKRGAWAWGAFLERPVPK